MCTFVKASDVYYYMYINMSIYMEAKEKKEKGESSLTAPQLE
jgi:hypothetical protein